jgi:hypothetical protein
LGECGREWVVEGGEDCHHKRDPDIEWTSVDENLERSESGSERDVTDKGIKAGYRGAMEGEGKEMEEHGRGVERERRKGDEWWWKEVGMWGCCPKLRVRTTMAREREERGKF